MGKKAVKRRLGKKVINGSMTLTAAWNRLERAGQGKRSRQVTKSAGSTPPAVVYEPGREDEYMQSAFAPLPSQLQPTTIQKARQAAFDRQYDQAIAPVREFIAKALQPAAVISPPAPATGLLPKQLTRPERAAVAELRRQLGRVAHDPARREEASAQIARITGDPFTLGGL